MIVRLTQIDGKLPNLALMSLSAFWRDMGAEVVFSRRVERDMLEPAYVREYGSAIFSVSAERVATFRQEFPGAIVGGTWNTADPITVESHLATLAQTPRGWLDYSIYPDFEGSIGFTQRGCRLKCGFCVVPKKEGKPRSVNRIYDIWRGEGHPKHIHLLDNDFFGQPREQWEERIAEMRGGGFSVCFNQGVNIRTIGPDEAKALASVKIRDDQFKVRRLYTAWDNLGDEERFFKGVNLLEEHGVSPTALLVYMLIGYDKRETWERVMYRFEKMTARGIRPYPMVYGDRERTLPLGGCNQKIGHRTLREFQRWAIRKAYTFIPFEHYDVNAKGRGVLGQLDLLEAAQ